MKRRSVRRFTDRVVEGEVIDRLLAAGCSAPSACNRKTVDFYVITGEEKLNELSDCGRFTRFKSPLMIIVVGNLNRALPLGLADYWIHDAAAATENILIRATDLGLGTCWCGVYLQENVLRDVQEALSLPRNRIIPFSLIRIGYPDEEREAHGEYDPMHVEFVD